MTQAKSRRNYSQIDKEVYDLLLISKKEYIEDLEEKVDLSREKSQKSIARLEKKGKIQSQRVLHSGKWTTEVKLVENYGLEVEKSKHKGPLWNTLDNLPCFTCPDISKCSDGIGKQGDKEANPNFCQNLSDWIDAKLKGEPFDKIFQPDFEEIRAKKRKRRKRKEEREKED